MTRNVVIFRETEDGGNRIGGYQTYLAMLSGGLYCAACLLSSSSLVEHDLSPFQDMPQVVRPRENGLDISICFSSGSGQ